MEHPPLRVLDDQIALLSLRAAQEVDRKLHGGNFDQSILVKFGKMLSEASGIAKATQTAFLCSDPTATEVFYRAIEEATAHPVNDLGTLTEGMKEIIEPLVGSTEDLSKDKLKKIKAFCLAFHKALASQRLPKIFERETSFDETACR
jgi:hypothetical protein